MQNNVFLRLAQERYTTKHYNGQQIPREEFDTLLEILRLTPTSHFGQCPGASLLYGDLTGSP